VWLLGYRLIVYKAGPEGHIQPHHKSNHRLQPQCSKDVGSSQVRPSTEEPYRNPSGSFLGTQPTKEIPGGEQDRGEEKYGGTGPEMPKEGLVRSQGQSTGDQRGPGECTKHGPGDIGLATHQDVEGPHLYEMEGVGRREPGRDLLAHRVYSPAPKDTGYQDPECMQHDPGDIGFATHRDADGPHLYEMEGVGRREEGGARRTKGHESAAKDPSDVKGQEGREATKNKLGELNLDKY